MSLKSFIYNIFNKKVEPEPPPGRTSAKEEIDRKAPEEEEPAPSKPEALRDYAAYCDRLKPLVAAYEANFSKRHSQLGYKPLISVLLPVYNPEIRWLRAAIESVKSQIYPHWELCIADDASTDPEVKQVLNAYHRENPNIHVQFRPENGHISDASNTALEMVTGEFIALLDHDDEIPRHALARVADCLNENRNALLVYTDEDKIDENGERSQPHFKSNWNPDLLLGQNYISHLGVYQTSVAREVGGFRKGFEGAQDWDLALRVSARAKTDQIVHIPEVLYHWRSVSGSTARDIDEKDYAHLAAKKVIEAHFKTSGIEATLEPVDRYYWRPRYRFSNPKVAIIIPSRDRVELLKECVESIQAKTKYSNYHLVIADNDSREESTRSYFAALESSGVEIVSAPGKFNFSRIANLAINERNENIICLLNNDTTVINEEWLDELVMHAQRDEIGPIGAKLLYPHDHVQHAGIVLGIGGIGSEAFKFIHKTDDGYIHRAFLIGNYSAVTGACMAFRKSVWESVVGFDEENTPNAYSDVDFCLRCGENGYRSLFTPFAQLYHAESASRGPDESEEFKRAETHMRSRWNDKITNDPYYNPNLTLAREDFTFAELPRGYSTL